MLMNGNTEEISLYFHIPFCKQKCHYCHFYVIPEQEILKNRLLDSFKKEWLLWQPLLQNKKIVSIYFGGGTPSLFGVERIASLIDLINKETHLAQGAEITLEANPDGLSLPLLKDYLASGVNRLSLGIQTLDDQLLQILGRLHSAKTALQSLVLAEKAGFTRVSIDLMYDLPHQNLSHWASTLKSISQQPISHLSLYNLTIEPHTVFFKKQAAIKKLLPDEQTSLEMYEMAMELLPLAGLIPYEISAFAKNGDISRHNTGYWTGRPFLGFGPSAFSYWNEKRFRNVAHLNKYCEALDQLQSPIDFEEKLTPSAQQRELLVIQLRLKEGVNLKEFEELRGELEAETKGILARLIEEGLISRVGKQLTLTRRGVLFYETVAAELI